MTTGELIQFMRWVHDGCIGVPDPVDYQKIREDFVRQDASKCLDTIIEVLHEQLNEIKYRRSFDELDLALEAGFLLGICGRLITAEFVAKTLPLLQDADMRSVIIQGMNETDLPERINWLTPLVAEVEKMPEMDIIYLIDAVGDVGRESICVIQQLQGRIPSHMKDAHEEIEGYLKHFGSMQGR